MTHRPLHDIARIEDDLRKLAAIDPDIDAAFTKLGVPAPRVHPTGFPTLLRIIVGQQVSTRSAAAIWQRLADEMGDPASPRRFLEIGEAGWRRAGLSRPKMRYGEALAHSIMEGAFDPDTIERLDDETAIAAITALKGFGRWSAEIYLLFALARPDVMPADDLAIQVAWQRLKKAEARPKPDELRALTEAWTPFRGAATLLLWHWYGAATLDAGD